MADGLRRCAVITGASSGVGKATAKLLAAQGWHVICHGRDPDRTSAAEEEIGAAAAPGAKIDMVRCDLALLSETAQLAQDIFGLTGRIDALINNAGGVRSRMALTPEGNEVTFAGNHLGHFLLTKRLLPVLRNTAASTEPGAVRVLSVSSEGHRTAPELDWGDLQRTRDWVSGRNYCLAKLCNILFTRELARREASSGIVANAMHPGEVASNFASHAEPGMQAYMDTLDLLPPEISAKTLAWLASAPEAGNVNGEYFFNCEQLDPSPAATNASSAARLWVESDRLLARAGF